MLIVCPACASEYVIDASRLGAEGRSVRCAACRETWLVTPDDVASGLAAEMADIAAMSAALAEAQGPSADGKTRDEAQAALDAWEAALAEEGLSASPEPDPEPPKPRRARRAKAAPRRKGFAGISPMAALGLAALAGLGLALLGRSTVVRAMPQTAALYARVGLPVNLRGLDLRDVAAFQTQGEAGQGQLVVEGDVVGVATGPVAAPPIAIVVRDERGQSLYRWTVPSPRPTLDAKETTRFRASLSAPPAQGRSIEVSFAEAEAPPEPAATPDAGSARP